MRTRAVAVARDRSAVWTERKQDLFLISSFGAWAVILGLAPLLAFRALLP
jgi:hypothetical protein